MKSNESSRRCHYLDRVRETREHFPDKINTLVGKNFPDGNLRIVGAIAPANLARRSIRYPLCDEVDKYPVSAG
jgi:phage terminase large subunit GpA-like protein